ncbi:collagen alpha-1(I) chain-like, partial [Homarus americanus]|uniref:collagen alpha-1(I) chain-like n=1 Tax=Homarus americanus TaxID=6706 RepID=UPI001C493A5D
MGDVVASPSALNNTKTTAPRDHTGLALSGNLPGAAGNLLEVAGALGTHPGAAEAPGTHQEAAGDLGLNQRPYRAGALREPPRCGREHPSSGWGHWDPPKGSRGPMDPSQRQLVTWFSPRDHTGLTLLGNHTRATGNLLGVAEATWDPPRGSRGPRDPPRGSQERRSYPDKVVPPGTLQVCRDHTGLTLLGNHPRATGNLLEVAGATWDPPRGSRGPRDPPRGSQGPWSYPDKVVPPGTLQRPYRAGALREPPRCGREHPSSGWGHWDPPKGSRGPMDASQRQLVTWFSPRDHTGLTLLGNHPRATGNLLEVAGATWEPPRGSRGPRDPPRGSQERGSYPDKVVPPGTLQRPYRAGALREPPTCGREHPSSGWGHWDPPRGSRGPMDPSQRQLVTWFSPRCVGDPSKGGWDSLDPPMDGGPHWNHRMDCGGPRKPHRGGRAPATPPRSDDCTKDPPRGGGGPQYLSRCDSAPRDPPRRPYRAGALREPPRCGREHPSSGWGHWDPPRGSRGPMDPSQRQLVTWFSPRDHTGLTLLGNHPRATGNLLGVAGATWDPPRGSRGPRDPPRGSQGPWSYPDKVVPPGTLQRPYRAGALREPPRCGREHPSSGWGHWDPAKGSRGPMDPSQRQLVTWFSPRDHTGLTLLGNHPRATGNLLEVAGATWDPPRGSRGPRDPPRGSQGPWSYPDKVVPPGTLQVRQEHPSSGWGQLEPTLRVQRPHGPIIPEAAGDLVHPGASQPSKGGWDSLDPSGRAAPTGIIAWIAGAPGNLIRRAGPCNTSEKRRLYFKDPPRGGGVLQYLPGARDLPKVAGTQLGPSHGRRLPTGIIAWIAGPQETHRAVAGPPATPPVEATIVLKDLPGAWRPAVIFQVHRDPSKGDLTRQPPRDGRPLKSSHGIGWGPQELIGGGRALPPPQKQKTIQADEFRTTHVRQAIRSGRSHLGLRLGAAEAPWTHPRGSQGPWSYPQGGAPWDPPGAS